MIPWGLLDRPQRDNKAVQYSLSYVLGLKTGILPTSRWHIQPHVPIDSEYDRAYIYQYLLYLLLSI
jgi:hypothetical protein